MTLPKLSEHEYEEMKEELILFYEDIIWFISVSADFFDNMYGNTYENDFIKEEDE